MRTLVNVPAHAVTAILMFLALVASSPQPVRADAVVGTGTADSCNEAEFNSALAGGGRITFACGSGPVAITVTSRKTITVSTSLDGGGLITLTGGGTAQVFAVDQGATLSLANLTISGGQAQDGGTIVNSGTLTVTNCTFLRNTAQNLGGAIYNDVNAMLTIANSSFSDNTAPLKNCNGLGGCAIGAGGAIFNVGALMVTNCTFSGNSATYGLGGAIANNLGTLTVTNSTFSGNRAGLQGGAIDNVPTFNPSGSTPTGGMLTVANSTFYGNHVTSGAGGAIGDAQGTVTLINSTFSGNSATMGGAIAGNDGLTLTNVIIADSAPTNCAAFPSLTDGGHNLDSDGSCGVGPPTDPMLDPAELADNGGPTETIALLAGSPAINAGDESVCSAAPINGLDQRGFVRPGTGAANCSVGAYEYNPPGLPSLCAGDCGGAHAVAVNDIITLVNILLGDADPSACAAGIPNGSTVNVALIIRAVTNLLSGCPGG